MRQGKPQQLMHVPRLVRAAAGGSSVKAGKGNADMRERVTAVEHVELCGRLDHPKPAVTQTCSFLTFSTPANAMLCTKYVQGGQKKCQDMFWICSTDLPVVTCERHLSN